MLLKVVNLPHEEVLQEFVFDIQVVNQILLGMKNEWVLVKGKDFEPTW